MQQIVHSGIVSMLRNKTQPSAYTEGIYGWRRELLNASLLTMFDSSLILTACIEETMMLVDNRATFELLLRMTHFSGVAVWSLWNMSSQVDDVDLLGQAGGASACTAWQGGVALQRGLHRVSRPHRQQLTRAAKHWPCSQHKNTVWMKCYRMWRDFNCMCHMVLTYLCKSCMNS